MWPVRLAEIPEIREDPVPVLDFDRARRIQGRFANERAGYSYAAHDYAGLTGASSLPPPADSNPLEDFFDNHLRRRGSYKWRHYFDIYHRHFAKFRGEPVTLIEVGVASGGSMELWKDYFGPDCCVHGVDIDPTCKAFEDDRVTVHIGDQAEPAFWREFLERVTGLRSWVHLL